MTTPHQAYNQGALALAQEIGYEHSSDFSFIIASNPYPADETWTLFEPSDDIDYDALEGREAKLVHESGAEIAFTMQISRGALPAYMPSAWSHPIDTWQAFRAGWFGRDRWKLYIQGDLPTKRVTTDTLEPGTCFAGVSPGGQAYDELIRIKGSTGRPLVYSTFFHISFDPSEVEVTEVYGIGTFQKPTKEEA